LIVIKGANHYYFGQPREAVEATTAIRAWILEHGLDDGR
jgi:hypothetical protein